MKHDDLVDFPSEGGKTVQFTIARLRYSCPTETAAFEGAVHNLWQARQNGEDTLAIGRAGEEVNRQMAILQQAIIAEGRRRQWANPFLEDKKGPETP